MAQAGRSNILSIYHFRPSARTTSGRARSRPLVVRVYAGAAYGDAGVSLFVAAVSSVILQRHFSWQLQYLVKLR